MTDNDAVAGVRLASRFPEVLLNCLKDDEQGGDNEEQLWKASSQQRMSARQLRR